jgi:hypothetical protein
VGFKPIIPAFKRAKTVNALDSVVTEIGCYYYCVKATGKLHKIFSKDILQSFLQYLLPFLKNVKVLRHILGYGRVLLLAAQNPMAGHMQPA